MARTLFSTDEHTGTTRYQIEAEAMDYADLLQVEDYEGKSVKNPFPARQKISQHRAIEEVNKPKGQEQSYANVV